MGWKRRKGEGGRRPLHSFKISSPGGPVGVWWTVSELGQFGHGLLLVSVSITASIPPALVGLDLAGIHALHVRLNVAGNVTHLPGLKVRGE